MLTSAIITVTNCGSSEDYYDIYFDYVAAPYLLKQQVQCTELLVGYTLDNLPSSATSIILTGIGLCTNTFTIPIVAVTPSPTPTSNLDCNFTFTVTKG